MSTALAALRGILATLLALLLLLVAVGIAGPPLYRFPPPQPFSGPHWYNPYAERPPELLRVNLHAHSLVWSGLTYADATSEEVVEHYRALGYDLAALSNYMTVTPPIDPRLIYLPTYEHGVSVPQFHLTVVGAESALPFDYPLWQTVRHKQHLIELLRPRSGALVINHPRKAWGTSAGEMAQLTGYTGVEVRSRYHAESEVWDAALSAGRVVWGIASDDTHRLIEKPHRARNGWLRMRARARSADAVLNALLKGRFTAVWDPLKTGPNRLLSLRVQGGAIEVALAEEAKTIRFIGQSGVLRAKHKWTARARYVLREDDTYLRVETETRDSELLLQPVFRYDGEPFRALEAEPRLALTWVVRGAVGAVTLAGLWGLLGFALRGRRR